MARTYQNISIAGSTFKSLRAGANLTDVPNTVWRKTAAAGLEVATKYGNAAKKRAYTIWLECGGSPDDQTTWNTVVAGLSEYSSTFTFIDHKGSSFTARFVGFSERPDPDHAYDILIDLEVIETNP